MRGKQVPSSAVIGGTITEVEIWGPVHVLGTDGLSYQIRQEIGYSGPENVVYETQSSVAKRAAKTRKRNKEKG